MNSNSYLSIEDVKSHLRIVDEEPDIYLENILEAAITYVANHTGQSTDDVTRNADFKQAILILCSDFYWNRDYQTDNRYSNRLVDNIIENNRVNFL